MSTSKPPNSSPRIAVVGGGISGLSAAYFLEQEFPEAEIHLFESSPQLGGKIQTRHQNGLTLELGAESFLSRKPHGIGLCDQLQLTDQLRGTNPANKKTFVWHGEQLHKLPEGLSGFVPSNLSSLKTTTLLNWFGKMRIGLDYYLPVRKNEDDESLASFISRRLGKQAYQRLVQPLLCGIYCADGKDLSLNATFPDLKKLVAKHGSLIRGLSSRKPPTVKPSLPPFVTLPNGMGDLIESVQAALKRTEITLDKPTASIQPGQEIELQFVDGAHENFDAIIVTTSSQITARFFGEQHAALKSALQSIPHVSTATVNLWYQADDFDADLNGYGFVVPADQQRGLTAVTWTSSKHFDRAPNNMRLIRAYVGKANDELSANATDQEILAIVFRELKRTMKLTAKPMGSLITRWPGGSPQYNLGHLERLATIDEQLEQLPGIFLCGSSFRGVGIPDCIRQAKVAVQRTIEYLKR
jgi:oxygen-dependent protoporphyrinogen oxidase